jgi:hypothetical protein
VSTTSGWHYHSTRLALVLATWQESDPAAHAHRRAVNECLMDVVASPLIRGKPDPDHEGMWEAHVTGTQLTFTYIPNAGARSIWPLDIS